MKEISGYCYDCQTITYDQELTTAHANHYTKGAK